MNIPNALIKALPKTDLHVHLDGSLRLSTLLELAKEYGVLLPSYTEGGLKELVFKDEYEGLGDYLAGFKYTTAVMQSEVALERIAYELGLDNQAEGVRYIEVRFAPQLHIHAHLNAITVLKSVDRGLCRAASEFNGRPEVVSGQEPPFKYGIIVCAMRMFDHTFSEYFNNLLRVHPYTPPNRIYGMASLELARMAVHIRNEFGVPIVGFDLAGQEEGYPAGDHHEAFAYAHRYFLKKTVHAGEAYGPESIFQAITDLHADRIGHGFHLMDREWIKDESIEDRERYVRQLAEYIADRRITIEVCLTSNMQTNPNLRDLSEHAFSRLWANRLSTTFCTDNRLISNTSVTNELDLAARYMNLSLNDLRRTIVYGFKRSFFPGSYLEKREYVRTIIDYTERLIGAHQSAEEPHGPLSLEAV